MNEAMIEVKETPGKDADWSASPLELTEHERRAAWFALSCRIEKKEKRRVSTRASTKRHEANLLKGEKIFLDSISQPVGSDDLMVFHVDQRGDNVVATVEALRVLRERIAKAASTGMNGWALAYAGDFCDAALRRFEKAAPADCHEHLKLEVVSGAVRYVGSTRTE